MGKPLILVTRTVSEARETARDIEKRGGEALVAPLRVVETLASDWPARPALIIATSANAFRGGERFPTDWRAVPVLVVGDRTAQAARDAGFEAVRSVDGDAAALIAALEGSPLREEVLYLAGEPRKPDIETFLRQVDWPHCILLRYRMRDVSRLPDSVCGALAAGEIAGVLHFSAESARTWLALARQAVHEAALFSPLHACLSPGIADVIREAAKERSQALRITVAARPRADALLDACFDALATERPK